MLEVLVVIAAVAVVATIVLATGDGSNERARINRARAELAIIAKGLEDYRAAYGDYPWVSSDRTPESTLREALLGYLMPSGERLPGQAVQRGMDGRLLVDSEVEVAGEQLWVDPWGTPYIYRYRGPAAPEWARHGYVLLSLGPSALKAAEEGRVESPQLPSTGLFPPNYREWGDAYDNILATY